MDKIFVGDRSYSSWSLRGWLLFDRFGLPVRVQTVDFTAGPVAAQMGALAAPARTVPAVQFSDGTTMWDSLAIAEEMAQRHPDAGFWPADPAMRALLRSATAEMHSGFAPLRTDCPMHLRVAYRDVPHSDDVLADAERIDELWRFLLERSGGPWLGGAYSIADTAFAPVAARFAGYGFDLSATAQAYVDAHLSDLSFRRWRAMGLVHGQVLPWYERPNATRDWPGPTPDYAEAVDDGPSVNAACPYSGDAVTHFLRYNGKIWGFCNAFCRDKTAADPMAWPAFAAMVADS